MSCIDKEELSVGKLPLHYGNKGLNHFRIVSVHAVFHDVIELIKGYEYGFS